MQIVPHLIHILADSWWCLEKHTRFQLRPCYCQVEGENWKNNIACFSHHVTVYTGSLLFSKHCWLTVITVSLGCPSLPSGGSAVLEGQLPQSNLHPEWATVFLSTFSIFPISYWTASCLFSAFIVFKVIFSTNLALQEACSPHSFVSSVILWWWNAGGAALVPLFRTPWPLTSVSQKAGGDDRCACTPCGAGSLPLVQHFVSVRQHR